MSNSFFRNGLLIVVLLCASSLGSAGDQSSTAPGAMQEKSLYDRLGGVYPISMVVDRFIEKLFVNDVLNANPAINEARARVPKEGLKFHVTTLVCQVTGGPCQYTGRSMKESHAHLNITEKEWDVMVTDFVSVLNQFKVPQKEQDELLAIVGTTKADIVMKGPQAGK